MKHETTPRALFATMLLVAAMAVAFLAMPTRALADTVEINQANFTNAGGHLTLTSSGERTYKLTGDVMMGSVDMYVTEENAKLTLDLNGHIFKCTAGLDRIAIHITAPSNVGGFITVTNGTVVQESAKAAIRTENVHFQPRTYLKGLTVTATNQHCAEQAGTASLDVIGGSYTTTNTGSSNASVIYCARDIVNLNGARITLNGGDTIIENGPVTTESLGIHFSEGTSFSQAPDPNTFIVSQNYALYKKAGTDEYWEVVRRDDDFQSKSDVNWYVRRSELWLSYYWYFEDKDEAQAFCDKYSGTFKEIYTLSFTFSFNPDNGEQPTVFTDVHYGTVISKDQYNDGNDPVYDPYIFQSWKKNGNDYNFSSTIKESVTVNASWGVPAATVNGKGYYTLEEAVEAAYSGCTIVLFKDVTRTEQLNITDKGNIRLDLNGKTLTYSGANAAIVVENTALTVSDSDKSGSGQINGSAGCVQLNSGVLSIEGGTYTSSSVAIAALDGSLSISGGTVQSSSVDYDVTLMDNAVGTVSGGYIKGYVRVNSDSDLRVTGGSFGTDANKPSVPKGYHMLKGSDGRYTVAAHTWPNSYTYNGNGTHSRTCTAEGCTETDTAQCWGTTATCVKGRVCYTCGGVYTEPDSDNHVSAATEWTTDALKHWHKCTACGDVYPNTEAEHTFKWVTDVEPTVSAPGREHEECSICGYKSGVERAIPQLQGDAPVISDLTAGVAYDGATTFTVTDPDDDLASVVVGDQTLTPAEDGKTYTLPYGENITVVATDANNNTTSVTVSSYADHDWSAWTSLGGTHERTCSHNGCTVKVQRGTCTGGEATCSAKAVCETCQGEYGSTDPTKHVSASVDWSTSETKHWHACTACGEVYPNTGAEHTFTWVVDVPPTVTTEGSEHEECSVCHYKSGRTHVIPKYTGEAPVITDLTEGLAYDGVTTFTVTDDDGDLVSVTANGEVLKAGEDGMYTLPNLGENIEVVAIDANGNTTKVKVSSYDDHNWSNWVYLGDGTHERTCRHSGCTVKTEQGACTGGKATCSAGAKCEVCGYTFTDVDPDNHVSVSEDWEHDDDAHWHVCNDCGAIVSKGEHEFEDASDDDYTWRECTTCGLIKDKTKKPDSGDDDDDDEDDKGKGDEGKGDQDGGSDKSDSGSDSKKATPADRETLPATGDPLICELGIVLAGAAVVATGAKRRKQ